LPVDALAERSALRTVESSADQERQSELASAKAAGWREQRTRRH
jgi:hypothetical protein